MRDLTPSATRRLTGPEQVRVLRNQIAFLDDEIAEKEKRLELLVEDNAEMEFLSGVNERVRTAAYVDLYLENLQEIERLRGEIDVARRDLLTYRRVLSERFGVTVP
jgi:hypothetical protein